MWEANGLLFGRTFGNSFGTLALTVLREEVGSESWGMVGDRFGVVCGFKPNL